MSSVNGIECAWTNTTRHTDFYNSYGWGYYDINKDYELDFGYENSEGVAGPNCCQYTTQHAAFPQDINDGCKFNCTENQVIENLGNSREKIRLSNINTAFDSLRRVIPMFPYEKRLTKIETLRLAISYIYMLKHLLSSDLTPADFIHRALAGQYESEVWYTLELSARLGWLDWTRLGIVN